MEGRKGPFLLKTLILGVIRWFLIIYKGNIEEHLMYLPKKKKEHLSILKKKGIQARFTYAKEKHL